MPKVGMFSGFGHFWPCFFTMTSFCANFRKKIDKKKKCIWHLEGHGKSQQAFVASGQLLFLRKKTFKKFFFSDKKKSSSALPPSIGIQYTLPRGGNFPRWGIFFFFFFLTMFRKICRKYLFSAIPAIHWASHFHTPLLRDNSRFGAKSLKRWVLDFKVQNYETTTVIIVKNQICNFVFVHSTRL